MSLIKDDGIKSPAAAIARNQCLPNSGNKVEEIVILETIIDVAFA